MTLLVAILIAAGIFVLGGLVIDWWVKKRVRTEARNEVRLYLASLRGPKPGPIQEMLDEISRNRRGVLVLLAAALLFAPAVEAELLPVQVREVADSLRLYYAAGVFDPPESVFFYEALGDTSSGLGPRAAPIVLLGVVTPNVDVYPGNRAGAPGDTVWSAGLVDRPARFLFASRCRALWYAAPRLSETETTRTGDVKKLTRGGARFHRRDCRHYRDHFVPFFPCEGGAPEGLTACRSERWEP